MNDTAWSLADSEVASVQSGGKGLLVVFAAALVSRDAAGVSTWGYLNGVTLEAFGVQGWTQDEGCFGRVASGSLARVGAALVHPVLLPWPSGGPSVLALNFSNGASLWVQADRIVVRWPAAAMWRETMQC